MPYQAEARIACRITGKNADVSIGRSAGLKASHPAFNSTPTITKVFQLAAAAVGTVANDDIGECILKAKTYLAAELPAAFSLDDTQPIELRGHAWRDGHWVPTNASYVGYAFPVQYGGENIQQESEFKDPTGANTQWITLNWYVVVQPR